MNLNIESLISKVKDLGSSSSSNGNALNTSFNNSIFTLAQNYQTATYANNQQQLTGLERVITGVFQLLTNISRNTIKEAEKEVETNEKNIEIAEEQAEKETQETDNKIKELTEQIVNNTNTINSAIVKLEELGGDQGLITKAKEELEKQLALIEEAIKVLNDPKADKTSKDSALATLETASAAISNLVNSIGEYQTTLNEQVDLVANTSKSTEELLGNAVETITKGVENVQEILVNTQAQTAVNAKTLATGTTDTAQGATLIATGTAMESNLLTATQGADFIKKGGFKTTAGQKRIAGTTKNLAKLTQTIGQIGSDISTISNMTNAVGQIGNGALDLIGAFSNQVDPIITTIGSWEKVADANVQLIEAINNYSAQNSETQTNQATQTTQEYNTQDNDNRKFQFDTNLFRAAFEE